MDVSNFMGGNWLTHMDLPQPNQVWHIRGVSQQMVGTDQKICVAFNEHQKQLGLNKTNLRAIASAYGTDSNAWIGKSLEVFRDRTLFQGQQRDCVRVRPVMQQQPAPVPYAPQQPALVAYQPAPQQPVQPQPQPPAVGPATWDA